ncbi:hypothetical protein [Streptomyces sp. TS71-3]|uniref:hypothetical protein n=1 Tax=Streptomyces sp. TS71-3 TaxID=2733862 RepID=UPI001AFCF08B|nr:hypothetical protein [Streptomyces sp. TS71-3]GHJ35100.1 hypothetical protein Sm713_07090 [Streptomyces sp. TS71-3]
MVRRFDADRQEWASDEQEDRLGELRRRDALRQRQALLVSVAVLAVCGIGFGTYALGWKDEPKPPAAQPSRPPGSGATAGGGSGSPTPYPSEPSSPASTGAPAGYQVDEDTEGFRIAVPDGWQRSTAGSAYGFPIVNYRSSDGSRRLQVYEVQESSPDESLQTFLEQVPKSEGFKKLSLEEMPDAEGRPGARLEYVTDKLTAEPDIGGWHVVDHRFEAADGKLYALASYGAEADGRADETQVLNTALAWFCPPLTECEAPAAGLGR